MKKVVIAMMMGLVMAAFCFGQIAKDEVAFNYLQGMAIYYAGSQEKITNEILTAYAQTYKYDTYIKYKDDEFEWHDQFSKIKDEVNKMVTDTVLGNYYIVTGIEFGSYDFDKSGFPIQIPVDAFFPVTASSNLMPYVNLGFVDYGSYNFLGMKSDDANKFLKSRKNSSGQVNRKVSLLIHFTISDYQGDDFATFKRKMADINGMPVLGTITRIDVLDKTTKIGELTKK